MTLLVELLIDNRITNIILLPLCVMLELCFLTAPKSEHLRYVTCPTKVIQVP